MWITFTLIVASSSVILPASFDIKKNQICFLDKFRNYKCFKTGALVMAGRIFGVKIPSFNSESGSEFEGFLPQDIDDIEVADISDLDIEISSVSLEESDHDEDFGEERDQSDSGEYIPTWSQNLQEIDVDQFLGESGPNLPENFNPQTALPVEYFRQFSPESLFDDIIEYTKRYAKWKI